MDRAVSYLPPQTDAFLDTSTRALRQSPLRLLLQDAGVLLKMLPYAPWIFLPLQTSNPDAELYPSGDSPKEMALQALLLLYEVALLIMFIPALVILPGSVFLILAGVSTAIVYLIAWPMDGSSITRSRMDGTTRATAEQHRDERWLFVNGCATGHGGLQANVDRISHTFGRAVIGVQNKTYGLVADVLECLIQRVFAYKTTDVRVAYEQVKAVLCDPTVSKVVLIGHSQGGIIISLVVDQLFDQLPSSTMSKLEIYTFGSAASHFSNPPISPKPARSAMKQERVIPYIEHYANEYDMVPRWGVLYSTREILSNRYAGSVFVRMGASGHLFNQHYMDAIFPSQQPESDSLEDMPLLADSFLDKFVDVDVEVVSRRHTLVAEQLGVVRGDTGLQFGDGGILPDANDGLVNGARKGTNPLLIFGRTNSGRLVTGDARGMTVRELSRLWRYQGGRSPDDLVMGEHSSPNSP
ncbi:MAG: hypothetical protein Q9163_003907 [Psora crenata]